MRSILIIGAGPAGSTAAALLARGGCDVTLVEQHAFPRDKVCGECLSALGVEILDRVDLLAPIRSHQPTTLTRTILHSLAGQSIALDLPRPMLGLSRRALDLTLLDAARAAGAKILQPVRCEGVQAGRRVAARLRHLRGNTVQVAEADLLLLADGKSSAATEDFGIKAHFENIAGPRDAIELFGVNYHYGGLAAIENNRWNTAFSVPAERLRASHGDLDRLFASILLENRSLRGRFSPARRVSDWLASPLPRTPVKRDWPANVIPVGNAAAALEPIGGEGMGLAIASAESAVRAILDNSSANRPVHLQQRFDGLWSLRSRACRAVAKLLSSPVHSDAALSMVDLNPALAAGVMGWIGK